MPYLRRITANIGSDDSLETKCVAFGLTNKGTASVTIDGELVLAQNEAHTFPVVSPDLLYMDSINIKFGATGTKKLLFTKVVIAEE